LDLCRKSLTPEALSRWLDGLNDRRRGSDARLRTAIRGTLGNASGRFLALGRVLHSLSPLAVLSRGFAAAFDDSGKPVTRTDQSTVGALLSLAFFDGGLDCTVTSKVPSHLPPVFALPGTALQAKSAGDSTPPPPRRVDAKATGALQSEAQEDDRG
jgi:hypothetical protein